MELCQSYVLLIKQNVSNKTEELSYKPMHHFPLPSQVEQCLNRLKVMKLDAALQELTELCPNSIQRFVEMFIVLVNFLIFVTIYRSASNIDSVHGSRFEGN